jgi:hypothetical protein
MPYSLLTAICLWYTAAMKYKKKLKAHELPPDINPVDIDWKLQWLTTEEEVLQAVAGSRGNISTIAKRLGRSRDAVASYRRQWATVARAIIQEREVSKDWAEGILLEKIAEGDTIALLFYLKTQAKDRGYVEGVDVRHIIAGQIDQFLDRLEAGLKPETFAEIIELLNASHDGKIIEGDRPKALAASAENDNDDPDRRTIETEAGGRRAE